MARAIRLLVIVTVHAALAGYLAAVAQQFLSVTSGRVSLFTLLAPSGTFPVQPRFAAIAGALIGPMLHIVMRRAIGRANRPRAVAAVLGIGYVVAVMAATIAIWLPATIVIGRAPGQSVTAALGDAAFSVVFGFPLFVVTAGILFSPVLMAGGAAIGMGVFEAERRRTT
jgi:hypothetical protein